MVVFINKGKMTTTKKNKFKLCPPKIWRKVVPVSRSHDCADHKESSLRGI